MEVDKEASNQGCKGESFVYLFPCLLVYLFPRLQHNRPAARGKVRRALKRAIADHAERAQRAHVRKVRKNRVARVNRKTGARGGVMQLARRKDARVIGIGKMRGVGIARVRRRQRKASTRREQPLPFAQRGIHIRQMLDDVLTNYGVKRRVAERQRAVFADTEQLDADRRG